MNDDRQLLNRLVRLTRDLVLIQSTDSRPAERARCFQFIRNHLESIDRVTLTRSESNGYESIIARPLGVSHPSVLFCAHLDVVDHPDTADYQSTIENGRIIGPGAGDMKGQLAILIALFTRLMTDHPDLSVGLMITSDEERGGSDGVRHQLEDLGQRCEVAIVPDGGSLNDVTIQEKGVLHLRVRAQGHSAHAARPWLARNPLDALLQGLSRLRQAFDGFQPDHIDPDDTETHWFPTCSLTKIKTPNESINRIPDAAEASLDVRFPPSHDCREMREIVSQALGSELSLETIMQAEPSLLEPDPLFLKITSEVTGHPVRTVRASAGSDARFFCQQGIPVLLSRPHVGNLHGRDEWIDIESMVLYYQICHRYTLDRLAG